MPDGVRHRRVAQCDSTVPRDESSLIKGCGTPEATAPPRTVSRVQSCVATDWEILLRPDVGEGRNMVLRRGRCADQVCEAVEDRFCPSVGIKEEKKKRRRDRKETPSSGMATSEVALTAFSPINLHVLEFDQADILWKFEYDANSGNGIPLMSRARRLANGGQSPLVWPRLAWEASGSPEVTPQPH